MLRQLRPAVASVLIFTVLIGLIYPAVVWGIARAAFPRQAAGSLVRRNGHVLGSAIIGQRFAAKRYFHPRPSAAGDGYDATASGATNLGPSNPRLMSEAQRLAEAYRQENGLAGDTHLPADAVTRSASGLDPDISPENAYLQVRRVAHARGLTEEEVQRYVARCTEGRTFGLLGEPRVNVLRLNLLLAAEDRK